MCADGFQILTVICAVGADGFQILTVICAVGADGFQILPVIVFFSSVISVLYYIGAMQAIVRVIGRFLSFCMGTTPAESLNAAGNIFVGMVTKLC